MAKPPKKQEPHKITPPAHIKKKRELSGSIDSDFTLTLVNQAINSMWRGHGDEESIKIQSAMALSALAGIAPKDEMEGMLATQMVGLHSAAMESMRRAMIPEQTFEARELYLNQASKLTRSYAQLVQTLDKRKGKCSQQKVTVEHVHVHEGGQAIVGAVAQNRGEGKLEQ